MSHLAWRVVAMLALTCSAGLQPCATGPSQSASQSQTTTFSSKVEAVRVDVLVADKGRPVRGLERGEFEIFDNGVRQEIDFASFEQIPLNVVLTFDMSNSVVGDRLKNLRNAAGALISGLRPADQAALVTFSNVVVQEAPLSANLEQVRRALDRTLEPGQTALIDGVHLGLTIGEADVGRALQIVFSDGTDTASWLEPELVLDTAKRSDVVVYAVQAGLTKATFLREISALTGGTVLQADPTKDLNATFLGILNEFRQRYLLSYTPRGVASGGWHQLEVRVKQRGFSVKARPGYLAN